VPVGLLKLLMPRESFIRELPPPWPGLRETSLFE
jgi:hypothetical protein